MTYSIDIINLFIINNDNLIFNKLKTEFRKLNFINIKEEIKYFLNKIYDKEDVNCIKHSSKIINIYK
jgi:hypothetical protein